MGSYAEEGVKYPREVPPEPGMPPGWKGIEKKYSSGKYEGKIYTRYEKLDGSRKHVNSPTGVIRIHCEELGIDPGPMLAEYQRLQKLNHDLAVKERRAAKPWSSKEEREILSAKFKETFGSLNGPTVYAFPGWTSRWCYQANCDQVMVMYLDTEGCEHTLLTELTATLQWRIENGRRDEITKMVEIGKANADKHVFAKGSQMARSSGGVYEITPDKGTEGSVVSRDEHDNKRKIEIDAKREQGSGKGLKRRRFGLFYLDPVGPPQTGWAAVENIKHAKSACSKFQTLLKARSFPSSTGMIAVHGVGKEQRLCIRMQGVYFQLPSPIGDRPCYQKLVHRPNVASCVGCDGIYILWCSTESRWEMRTKPDEKKGYNIAYCMDSAALVNKVKAKWQVTDCLGNYIEDSGMSMSSIV